MNAAFEDGMLATVIIDAMRVRPWRPDAARKPHADAIADMALENFVESATRWATRPSGTERVEQELHALIDAGTLTMPLELRSPQYNLVSFSTVPYAEARPGAARPLTASSPACSMTFHPGADDLGTDARAELLRRRLARA